MTMLPEFDGAYDTDKKGEIGNLGHAQLKLLSLKEVVKIKMNWKK